MLSNMKIEELKNFLHFTVTRVKSYWKKKEILLARAFSAIKKNVTLVKTAQEVEAQLQEEYSKKLELEN